MSRRTSRKVNYNESDDETSEASGSPIRTPQKARKAVKVETAEVVTEVEKSTPAKSRRKGKAEAEGGGGDTAETAKSPAKVKSKIGRAHV